MKKFTEHVVVRDYGKQGLALFPLEDPANPGRVCCWSTLVSYENEPKGFRPDSDAPMCYGEASMGYYWRGKLVRPGSADAKALGLADFVERYKRWAIYGYEMSQGTKDIELEIVVVHKDQQRFRNERWKR
jgi:hypothetical protein